MTISSINISRSSNYRASGEGGIGKFPDGTSVKTITAESQPNLLITINRLFEKIEKKDLHSIEIKDNCELTANYMTGKSIKILLDKESTSTILKISKEILTDSSSSSSASSVEENDSVVLTLPENADPFSATKVLKDFYKANNEARQANKDIQSTENIKMKKLFTRLNEIDKHIEAIVQNPHDTAATKNTKLSPLKNEFNEISLQMKKNSEEANQNYFNVLEQNLFTMTQQYNQLMDAIETHPTQTPEDHSLLSELKKNKTTMHKEIHDLNQKMGERSLTTNKFTAYNSHVMSFAAIVEKKLTLQQRSAELETKGQLITKKESNELAKIKKELKGAPNQKKMEELATEIKLKLEDKSPPIEINLKKGIFPCFAKIKKEYKFGSYEKISLNPLKLFKKTGSHFEWGADYLNNSLTTPANWTTIRKAFIKESGLGKMYVSVSINEPLNIDERGGVPAGLRKAEGYNKRATNLIKTTSYIRSEAGIQSGHISFRGGQFPTVNAAKEALKQMRKHRAALDTLHINALLTPFELPFGSIQPTADKKLLAVHKKNINDAITELIGDPSQPEEFKNMLRQLRANGDFSMSNFGVNEGAVGELKKGGINLKWLVPGWHTSIKEYSNEASQKLTQSLQKTLGTKTNLPDYKVEDLDRLGSIIQVGQEMEAVWATNAYAEAKVGYNQFKLPSLWKTMDALIGVTCYTDCMSGKDRTGKVESQAQAALDEIAMNTIEHKKQLTKQFDFLCKSALLEGDKLSDWKNHQHYLTAACFTTGEIQAIFDKFVSPENGGPLGSIIKTQIEKKLNSAKIALGIEKTSSQFLLEKTIPKRTRFKLGTSGISISSPKRENPICKEAASKFPQIATSSLFSEYTINWNDVKKLNTHITKLGESNQQIKGQNLIQKQDPNHSGYQLMLKKHKQKHLEAGNSRLSQFGSLDITKMNTGKPGFKVEGGEPLARATCGFNRDYVLLKILGHVKGWDRSENFPEDFKKLVGLGEFDPDTQAVILSHLQHAGNNMDKYLELVKEIEEAKMQMFFPQAKVKA